MEKKILGKNVYFSLNDNGDVMCSEYKIFAPTTKECIALVTEEMKKIDASARANSGMIVMVDEHRSGLKRGKLGKKDGDSSWVVLDDGDRSKEQNSSIFIYDETIINDLNKIESVRDDLDKQENEIKKRLVLAVQ
jgi:hypothetical protein